MLTKSKKSRLLRPLISKLKYIQCRILKLQTEKDHDDFLNLFEKNRADNLKIQMTGSYHPDKFSKQLKTKEIYNSYDFQYSDYMRTLATASKMNL
jgi:hypothetical protein